MNEQRRSDLVDMLLWALAAAALTLVFAGVLDALDLLMP
jgi:hypothetical protein